MMRNFFAGLGARLAVSCALIAVIAVVVTGGVMYTSARNNIFSAEQDRLFDQFAAMREEATAPINCAPDECQKLTDSEIAARASERMRGISALVFTSVPGTAEQAALDGIPASFQARVQSNGTVGWWRERYGLSYRFLIGAPVSLNVRSEGYTGGAVNPTDAASGSKDRTVEAFLYASYPMEKQQQQVNALAASTLWLVGIMAILAALSGALLGRWISRPVRQLRSAVDKLDAGQGALELDVRGVQELTGLVEAFNAAHSRLHETLAELTQKEAASRRFVADVSHEIRTPVTAMVAMADVLEHSAGDPEHVQEAAMVTARAARRLSAMTEDLLEISRFDAQKETIQAETFDVAQRIAALVESRGFSALVEVGAANELHFSTDPRRFEVIVANLLTNAVNHGAAPINVHAFLCDAELVVEVSDHGSGIPAASAEHLFDRFYKTDTSRSRGGSGLGLSLVQENCKLLGGTVKLTSAVNPTTFTVRLPPFR
ncbi:cell wall metabolism sensor histidine kinase WalK [Arthrobacter sp. GMC3]|uniref:sensor histidine kinase n=1 Tax=Arthrobacter sp. GMC3 TaxID=2058894 RepID=UPI000CE40663|nr:HAMP domain-containing sensor histidine kinase [Arthrobacter sp. GMC3]